MLVMQARNEVLSKCLCCPAHMYGPCRGAGREALEALAKISHMSTYEKGATIVHQAEEYQQVGIIVSGVVKQTNVASDGRQTIVSLLEKGSLIGGIGVGKSRFGFEAASPVTICTMPKLPFSRILYRYPEVACQALELSVQQSESAKEWLTLFNCRTTLQRLVGYLHALALSRENRPSGKEKLVLDIPIARKDLAAYLATTPETLSRNFRRLSKMGILDIINGRRVVIISIARLGREAGESGEEMQSLSNMIERPSADNGMAYEVD